MGREMVGLRFGTRQLNMPGQSNWSDMWSNFKCEGVKGLNPSIVTFLTFLALALLERLQGRFSSIDFPR